MLQSIRASIFVLLLLFVVPNKIIANPILPIDSTQLNSYDTIYLAPDTIKQILVDTVYEYEDEPEAQAQTPLKKDDISIHYGAQAGMNISHFYPLYRETTPSPATALTATLCRNNWYIDFVLSISAQQHTTAQYNRHYSTIRNWTDTIKTVLDDFYQIVGNDTIHTQIIKKTLVNRSQTSHSDTAFSHQNTYYTIQIPLLVGYCYKARKTWCGISFGPSLRLLIASSQNKVSNSDSSIVNEKSFFRTPAFDFATRAFVKQKVTRRWWANCTILASVPLTSNYHSYPTPLHQANISISLGLEYYLRIKFKDDSRSKHY